jgi:hypothetical protein
MHRTLDVASCATLWRDEEQPGRRLEAAGKQSSPRLLSTVAACIPGTFLILLEASIRRDIRHELATKRQPVGARRQSHLGIATSMHWLDRPMCSFCPSIFTPARCHSSSRSAPQNRRRMTEVNSPKRFGPGTI